MQTGPTQSGQCQSISRQVEKMTEHQNDRPETDHLEKKCWVTIQDKKVQMKKECIVKKDEMKNS
jgi:hypothetical protein